MKVPEAEEQIASLHTVHYTLYTTHYTLHTTHYTLHTTHYTLHTTHHSLNTIHYTLYTTHYTLHTLHYTLFTTHCALHTPTDAPNFEGFGGGRADCVPNSKGERIPHRPSMRRSWSLGPRLSSENGTYKTVRARFWPWLPGKIPLTPSNMFQVSEAEEQITSHRRDFERYPCRYTPVGAPVDTPLDPRAYTLKRRP